MSEGSPLDMYFRMYDELKRNEHLFATKYKLHLPDPYSLLPILCYNSP